MRMCNSKGRCPNYTFILITVLVVFVIWFNLWLIPSVITSGIKSIANDCGKTYPVEFVLSGDWFCAQEQDE